MTKRRLVWIVLLVIVLLSGVPSIVAERYTSPTQDGQYLLNPVKSYGFILTLARVGGSATLSNSGKALSRAKTVFTSTGVRPSKVELLYLPGSQPYSYLSRSGQLFLIVAHPKLVWEIWGAQSPPDVIGFLDYVTGKPLGTSTPDRPGYVGASIPPAEPVTGLAVGSSFEAQCKAPIDSGAPTRASITSSVNGAKTTVSVSNSMLIVSNEPALS